MRIIIIIIVTLLLLSALLGLLFTTIPKELGVLENRYSEELDEIETITHEIEKMKDDNASSPLNLSDHSKQKISQLENSRAKHEEMLSLLKTEIIHKILETEQWETGYGESEDIDKCVQIARNSALEIGKKSLLIKYREMDKCDVLSQDFLDSLQFKITDREKLVDLHPGGNGSFYIDQTSDKTTCKFRARYKITCVSP